MVILVLGASGMLGRKLAQRIVGEPMLSASPVTHLHLSDVVPRTPVQTGDIEIESSVVDVGRPGAAERLISGLPDVIFDLAAVVSGEAETNFEKGYEVNLDGTRRLLEAVRSAGPSYRPRFVFASSIAVFGPPLPEVIGDDQALTPATSYGTQKAIAELLLADYTRRGALDGIGIRLPTICVRPGRPNLAASGFFSGIIREPLNGEEAILPVSDDVRHWFASPRSAVGCLLHAAALDTSTLGPRRSLTMPGVSATVGMQIAALRRVAGARAVSRIKRQPDRAIAEIIAGWPRSFDARRARTLGFQAEGDFDEIIRVYVEDELDGRAEGAVA